MPSAKDSGVNDVQSSSSSPHVARPADNKGRRLLCDASTVITIQMTEAEQKAIRDLKVIASFLYENIIRPIGNEIVWLILPEMEFMRGDSKC